MIGQVRLLRRSRVDVGGYLAIAGRRVNHRGLAGGEVERRDGVAPLVTDDAELPIGRQGRECSIVPVDHQLAAADGSPGALEDIACLREPVAIEGRRVRAMAQSELDVPG